MEFTNNLIFFGGLLICLSILAGTFSRQTGAPLLLAFMGVGVFFGENGPGGIVFNDIQLAYSVCSIALAIILFDGGIHTSLRSFQQALRPAILLAVFGVLITALITAIGIWYLQDINFLHALLFGSIVSSTDAAAVFLLLRLHGTKLEAAMSNILEVESGINDPMAIFLTLTFVELILNQHHGHTWLDISSNFIRQIGIGLAFGYAGGKLLTWFLGRIVLEPGLYPIFALAGGLLVFSTANLLDGSGFIAIYLAGLILGNHKYEAKQLVQQFMDGSAWLSQLVMLILLGLLVTPAKLIEDINMAFVVAGMLIFIARPVAVFFCLALEPFSLREKVFISWVGLRGAIPIYLAIIAVMHGLDDHYFNITFIVVICSLILQGWTIIRAAKILKLQQNT